MKVAVCSAQSYDRQFLLAANRDAHHELVFFESHLSEETRQMVAGFPGVCVFVNDTLDGRVLETLAAEGTRLIALRCAGFNNVDIQSANALGIRVVRVPAYSPHSVAEHTVVLMLALNRRLHQAYNRVRNGNFSLQGLLGFEMRGKAVGIIGTGALEPPLHRYCVASVAAWLLTTCSRIPRALNWESNMFRWRLSMERATSSRCIAPSIRKRTG